MKVGQMPVMQKDEGLGIRPLTCVSWSIQSQSPICINLCQLCNTQTWRIPACMEALECLEALVFALSFLPLFQNSAATLSSERLPIQHQCHHWHVCSKLFFGECFSHNMPFTAIPGMSTLLGGPDWLPSTSERRLMNERWDVQGV